jgi:peptidoglycan/xylan/chitin deacetylase (PgdA/CDA1 family)
VTNESSEFKPLNPGQYAVLLYHGVHADDLELTGRNSSGKHISESQFRQQMEAVARDWNVVSMLDIARAHRGVATLPPRAVAVTLDDGFANTYHLAWPVLREHGIRATFYLATGFIGTGEFSWTDKLEMMLLEAPPGTSAVSIGHERLEYRLGDTATRVAALTHMKGLCKQMPYSEVEDVLDQVSGATGVEPEPSHPLYEMLDWGQVREMAADGKYDFGAHTVDHIPLTRMPPDEMARQVTESLAKVSDEIGMDTKLFSYPEGQASDFDEASVGFLRSIGLDFCPSAIEGLNNVNDTDPFYMYRCMVGFEDRPFILS